MWSYTYSITLSTARGFGSFGNSMNSPGISLRVYGGSSPSRSLQKAMIESLPQS